MAVFHDDILVVGVETARMDEVDGFDLVWGVGGRHVITKQMLTSMPAPPGMPTTHTWMGMRAEDYPACQEQEDPSTTTITSVWTWTWDKIWMGSEYYHNGPNTLTPGVRWIGAMSDPVEIPWLDC
ncbi:MAG: hypothetical protein OXQ93_02785 [Gemmatimonadota bacterium]|nr:hypothetical protein [Gemmatimonadota bacterium]